jgi:hypothetical protein
MKQGFLLLAAGVVVSALCVDGAPRTAETGQFIKHAVLKGETVSLICIDRIGFWSTDLGKTISRDNPGIKNINLIFPGQTLALRNPIYKSEKPAPAQSQAQSQAPVTERSAPASQGVVTWVDGNAQIISKGQTARQKLSVNAIVYPGDVIITLVGSKVEIIIDRETVLRLKENTRLTLEAFRDNTATSSKTKVGFTIGSVWAKMKRFRDKVTRFDLELPTAIAGVHGTVYQASIDKDSSSEVKVYTGEVGVKNNPELHASTGGEVGEVSGPGEVAGPSEVSMEQWTAIVRDMQKISIDKKGKPKPVEAFKKSESDSWEKWNEERDKRIAEMFEEND